MNKKGFTLLELLVVVLIIGILAGIALPQYQMTVAKAKYAEIKTITQNIATSLQNYYLLNDTYKGATYDKLDIEIPKTIFCEDLNESRIRCCKQIFNTKTCFYRERSSGKPQLCLIHSTDRTDKSHKFCQKETGWKYGPDCGATYCQYYYTNGHN